MTNPPFWPEMLPVSYAVDLERTPMDVRARFEPDVGEPLYRPRMTGAIVQMSPSWFLTQAQIATFEAFYETDLAQGTKRFVVRDTLTDTPQYWKFSTPPRTRHRTRNSAILTADILVLPSTLWFSDYVKQGFSTVPAWVADYENDVYGIDGVKVAASELPTIEGTYLVRRVTTTTDSTQQETLTAGDITETAPADTTLIIGYDL